MTNTKNVAIPLIAIVAAIVGGAFGFLATADSAPTTDATSFITGHITLVNTDANGNIIDYVQTDNLIVDAGLDTIVDLVHAISATVSGTECDTNGCNGDATDDQFDTVGIGTGTSSATTADTDLITSISACSRVTDASPAGESSNTGTTEVQIIAQFDGSASCTGAVTEAVLGGATGESILARQSFTAINVGSSDSLTVTWNITYT